MTDDRMTIDDLIEEFRDKGTDPIWAGISRDQKTVYRSCANRIEELRPTLEAGMRGVLRLYKNPLDIGESDIPGATHPPENFSWDWKNANGEFGNYITMPDPQDAIDFAESLGMKAEFVGEVTP